MLRGQDPLASSCLREHSRANRSRWREIISPRPTSRRELVQARDARGYAMDPNALGRMMAEETLRRVGGAASDVP